MSPIALHLSSTAPGAEAVTQLTLQDPGAQAALARLTEAAVRLLRVPQAIVTLLEGDTLTVIRADGPVGLFATGESHPADASFCSVAVATEAPVTIADAASDPRTADTTAVRERGIAAGISAPLRVEERVVGAVSALEVVPRRWSDDDTATLGVLAAAAATELELRGALRAQRRTHAAARAFATLAEHSPDAICRIDAELRYRYVNPEFARLVGRPREQLLGGVIGSSGPLPALSRRWAADAQRVLAEATPVDRHYEVPLPGAERTLHFDVRFVPEFDDGGHARSVLVTARDVTGRYEALEQSRASEERYRSLVEAAPVGIAQVALDGRWLDASPRLLAMLGYSLEELRALRTVDVTLPGDPMVVTARVTDDFAPEGGEIDKRYVRRDGTPLWARVNAALVRDPRGAPRHYTAVIQDVSEQRAAELALRHSEERFRALVEHATELVAIVDEQGIVRYASPSHERVLGRAEPEMAGCDVFELVHPDDRPTSRASFADALRTGAVTPRSPLRVRHRDGSWRSLVVRATDMRHAPAVRGIVLNAHDVTEQLRLQGQLAQAQKMEALGQLAGGVAHDFNNILAAITTYAELLRDDLPAGDPRVEDAVEIGRAAARGASVTRQLLAFSRRQTLETETLDLVAVVREMSRMLRSLLPPGIVLELPEPDAEPVLVRATRPPLEQILLNLAVNARDAMPAGGRLTLAVTTRPDEAHPAADDGEAAAPQWAVLEIADTGLGMSEAVRAHIFEPFYTTKPVGEGTGLGLAMVYGLVTQFGGRIAVASAEGRGSTFTIAFPLAATSEAGPSVDPAVPAVGGERQRVLLVEDEPALRSAARRMLERAGYLVDDAPHGRAALAQLDAAERTAGGGGGRAPVDVVLSDVAMPELGGLALAQQVAVRWPELPVVLMSGYAELPSSFGNPDGRAGAAGAPVNVVGFVEKPFTADRLLRAVADALQGTTAEL